MKINKEFKKEKKINQQKVVTIDEKNTVFNYYHQYKNSSDKDEENSSEKSSDSDNEFSIKEKRDSISNEELSDENAKKSQRQHKIQIENM